MSKKNISYPAMIRQEPLSEFSNKEGQEFSIQCPVCLEYFLTKANHKRVVKCSECGNFVDL